VVLRAGNLLSETELNAAMTLNIGLRSAREDALQQREPKRKIASLGLSA
jgi:hypothetical protein